MRREELTRRSPLRLLERSIHGGLGAGNLGIMVARRGLGKTAFLVDIALDKMLRGRPVLHITLGLTVRKLVSYYEEIFADLAHASDLANVWEVRAEMDAKRRIQAFPDGHLDPGRLRRSLEFLEEHTGFTPRAVIVDHYRFARAEPDDLAALKAVTGEIGAELWMSAVTHRDDDSDGDIPEPIAHLQEAVDVILHMAHDGEHVHISLLKDHDNPDVADLQLALDPTTFLLVEEA